VNCDNGSESENDVVLVADVVGFSPIRKHQKANTMTSRVSIILHDPYPSGMARTKQIHLVARSLMMLGSQVRIFIPKPIEKERDLRNAAVEGFSEEIPYKYSWYTTCRSNHFIGRRFHDFVAPWWCAFLVLKQKPNIIVATGDDMYTICLHKLVSLMTGAMFVRWQTEVPCARSDRMTKWKIGLWRCVYRLFDGFVLISRNLEHLFREELGVRAPIIIVPVMFDPGKVGRGEGRSSREAGAQRTIVYVGTLTQRKDGIITILGAFGRIHQSFPDVRLVMTGDPNSSPDKGKILETIARYHLENKVEFLGYVPDEVLEQTMAEAYAFVLAKPPNRQNAYNMPFKVAEYLANGRPVVMTNVGTATDWLQDGVNAFLSEPTEEGLANRLEFVLNNPEDAVRVGTAGREYALSTFEYTKAGKVIWDFFNRLLSR
jgi:glycosyltransferase involved in cell wall biosynthesis